MYYKDLERSPYSTVQNVTNLNSQNEWEPQTSSSRVTVGTPHQKPKMINNKQVFIIGNGESRIGFDLEKLRDYGKIYGCNLLYEEFAPDVLIAIDERVMHPIYWSGYPIDNVCWFREWNPMPGEAYEALTDSSMISGDSTIEMSDYLYTNSRNDSTEFVLHGINKDRAEEYEAEVRELDTENVLDESSVKLVFNAGIYTTWLNTNGDKVKSMGPGSFPEEYIETYQELFKQYMLQGGGLDGGMIAMKAGPTAQLIASLVDEPTDIYLIGMDIFSQNERVNNVYKGQYGYVEATCNVVPSENFVIQHRDIFKLFPNIKHYKVNQYPLGTDVINQEIEEWKDIPNLEYLTYADMFGRLADGAR